jgi:hypothetical protein
MSKPNKANKSNYIQAGRLTPDDLAREQKKQRLVKDSGVPPVTNRRRGKRDQPSASSSRKAAVRR